MIEKKPTHQIVGPDGMRVIKGTLKQCVDFRDKCLENPFYINSIVEKWEIKSNLEKSR